MVQIQKNFDLRDPDLRKRFVDYLLELFRRKIRTNALVNEIRYHTLSLFLGLTSFSNEKCALIAKWLKWFKWFKNEKAISNGRNSFLKRISWSSKYYDNDSLGNSKKIGRKLHAALERKEEKLWLFPQISHCLIWKAPAVFIWRVTFSLDHKMTKW